MPAAPYYNRCKTLKSKLEPFELIEKIDSLETFLEFIEDLMLDKQDEEENKEASSPYVSGHNGWENNDIASFLDAMHVGTKDNGLSKEASWKNFAEIIYMGKIYE